MKFDKYTYLFWGILIATVVLWFFSYIRFYADMGFYGDQVHFLVMTQSIAEDDDLNVKNQYDNESYWDYYIDPTKTPIDPHLPKYKFDDNSEAWYPLHNPGLSMYLVPAFWLMGAKGAIYAMIFLNLLVLVLLYYWILKISNSKLGAIFGVLIMVSAPFFLNQVGYIFTDLPILGILLASLLLLFKKDKKWWDYLLLSIILGIGVWLHVKMALVLATIGFIALHQTSKIEDGKTRRRSKWAMIVPSLLLIGLFEIKLYQWYGVWSPTSSFAGDQMLKISPINSLSAYLFDWSEGFLINNPAFWLVFLGLPMWYESNIQYPISNIQVNDKGKKKEKRIFNTGRGELVALIIILGPTFLAHLTFDDWCGGYSPSGRYMISFFPILLPAIGFLTEKLKKIWMWLVFVFLIIWQSFYSFFLIYYRATWSLCGARSNIFIAIENKFGWSLDKYAPIFNGMVKLDDSSHLFFIIFYFLIMIALIYAGYRLSRKKLIKRSKYQT